MWKCDGKRIKLFCKLQNSHNNINTREARNDKTVKSFFNLAPGLLNHFNRGYGRSSYGPSSKKEKENPKTDGSCLDDIHNNLFNFFGWTGVLTIGWALLQPISHKRAIFNNEPSGKCAFHILAKCAKNEYNKLICYQNTFQPFNSILPIVEAKKPEKKKQAQRRDESEVLESNLQDLEIAHQKVLGVLRNSFGAECMLNKNYSEAVSHFEEAAKMQNASAMFNLGICHEMGWGTNQDLKKAAKMYKKASDLDHPTATYNLGIYYVHGLGDLKSDINEARRLFQKAASLGQKNAREALDLERISKSNSSVNINSVSNSVLSEEVAENCPQKKDDIVDGSYSQSKKLGLGIFSAVFADNMKVAVKMLSSDVS
ncbi:UNVERIFIED_CONTAM: hypothetical protein PYX00_007413 [Menopon gallinae]|uniref:Uncharacterized protein n=1 Tax=Menopon gallinae TaxID=328185 RepID=A0AAW2HJG3_9NEOP